MKKTTLIFLLFVCGFATAFSQDFFNAPDFKQIEVNVKNQSSSYYYPNLMERYMKSDSTMNLEEMRHLYFGYVYQPTYVPTDTSSYNNRLAEVLSKQSFTTSDYTDILQYADALLLEDPFNLRALNAKLFVYAQQNNASLYKNIAQQRRIVQDAIVSTGDGMSDKTPFHVIKVAHEYDILPFLGFTFGGEDKIVRGKKVNYLSLGTNRFEVDKVYFDISPVIDYVNTHGGGKM